jgi:uncharacterized protein YdeI (YjbR/CyaY-like superfamily)
MVHVEHRAQWSEWLAANHATSDGVWFVAWRAATGRPRIDYEAVIEELLRVGWIDGKARKVDAERTGLWCAPRRPTSGWSRPNKERVARLEAAGLMLPAGKAAIEAAKANGAWTLLDDVENLVVPDDLAAALAARPGARERWDGLSRSIRRATLERLVHAKRPETRAKRIAEALDLTG